MRITRIDQLHADGGLKKFSFLKLSTDDGLVGWSEFSEFLGAEALGAVIQQLSAGLIGADPRDSARIAQQLATQTRACAGGLNTQAAAAIENACLDLKGKAWGVPVHQLFGGALRDRLPVYWSHFGTYRARAPEQLGVAPLRSLADLEALAGQVRERGFRCLKTNVLQFGDGAVHTYMPGFGRGAGGPELNLDAPLLEAIVTQLQALRRGAGPEVGIALDLNFNFKPAGVRRIAEALEPIGLAWLETDLPDPTALAAIRQATRTPIASLEAVLHRRDALPYLRAGALDYAIIDVMWSGMAEAVRLASLADAHAVNVNSHAFSSPLGAVMGAHLCALAPNFHRVEFDVDRPAWVDALFTQPLRIEQGELLLPAGPGWGIAPDEAALRARPPRPAA